ncbi:MAG TPA: peptidoglycan-binding protein [Candidatus Paceibacterota bacterium]
MKTIRKTKTIAAVWTAIVFFAVISAFAVANAQTVTLGPGDSGSEVSALQTFLAADTSVYPEGLVTGYYGSLTTAAVQRYQCKNGIVCSGSVATTGYGRVGPATLAKIELQRGSGGGPSLPPVGTPIPGADINAPILSRPTAVTSPTSATINWIINEPASSLVMYSTSRPALSPEAFAAMLRMSDITFNTTSEVTLTGLLANTLYHYVIQSVDASGNIQYGIENTFRTNP